MAKEHPLKERSRVAQNKFSDVSLEGQVRQVLSPLAPSTACLVLATLTTSLTLASCGYLSLSVLRLWSFLHPKAL